MQKLLKINKKVIDEVEPLTEVFVDILSGKYKIRPGFKASLVVWNSDPFLLSSYPILVIAEGRKVYEE